MSRCVRTVSKSNFSEICSHSTIKVGVILVHTDVPTRADFMHPGNFRTAFMKCGQQQPLMLTPGISWLICTHLFNYLGTTLTNQNSIVEEIKSRLRSGNACYHSVQNLLSSRLLSKNLKIKIYRTIIFPVVLYGCETWSLTLREKRS